MMELLANKLRPKNISEIIGQQHLIGEDKVISNLVKNGKIFSMILYGKPGIGKTSIASAIINELSIKSKFLNATTNNKSDFDIAIEEAKMYGEMILIIDEIHRMNKDKQDILLPHIESGLIILIGLTTSNPYHKINPAIRSRCAIYELKELNSSDIMIGLKRALKELPDINIEDERNDNQPPPTAYPDEEGEIKENSNGAFDPLCACGLSHNLYSFDSGFEALFV